MVNINIDEVNEVFANFLPDQELPKKIPTSMTLLSGDASTRLYWRWKTQKTSYIVSLYPESTSKPSLQRYIYWQKKYEQAQLPVPGIVYVNTSKQFAILEDIGDTSLQLALANCSPSDELKFLSTSTAHLPQIRKIKTDEQHPGPIASFDAAKLNFEIQHALNYFISGYLGVRNEKLTRDIFDSWQPLVSRLSQLPKVLCHRDFHSRNLMLHSNKIFLIDFQDTMLGPIQYDLCSILDDCYYRCNPANYQKILKDYYQIARQEGFGESTFNEFFENYQHVKLQRQFKALGSFCYVWEKKKNPRYLRYISYVMESIRTSFDHLETNELQLLRKQLFQVYYEY